MEGKADRYQGNKVLEIRPRLFRDLQIMGKMSDIFPPIIEGHKKTLSWRDDILRFMISKDLFSQVNVK